MLRVTEDGNSIDGRRLSGRVHFTVPSTLLCIAAGMPAAPLVPLSADRSSVTDSTDSSEQTTTHSSFPAGSAAAATVTPSALT